MYNSYPRKLLLHNHMHHPPPPVPPPERIRDNTAFDANVVMVLSVLFCALICSLGLNSIIRCALRCSTLRASVSSNDDDYNATARLANTGIKKKALRTFPTISYAADVEMTECAICLSDFANGERVRVLPKCHHGFHVRCIDRWLDSHSSCPTCRHCLVETCNKIVGATTSGEPIRDVVVRIEPLQPEGLIRSHET